MTSITLASTVSRHLEAALLGADIELRQVDPISDAKAGSLTFVGDPHKHSDALAHALEQGAAVLVPPGTPLPANVPGCLIPVPNPRFAYASAVTEFMAPRWEPGIAETAQVHPDASIDPTARVGEFTVVREGAVIGANTEIRDHTVIGRNVQIGIHCLVKSHVVLGEEGFGIEKDHAGNNFRIPHLGSVVIGDHVEIGAFSTVCSGTILPTRVGDYTKTDDHVHIAHNAILGRNILVLAGAKISGSVKVGDGAWIGPNTVTIDGATLGRNSQLGMGAVALKSVPENEVRMGNPARRIGDRQE